MYRIKCHTPLIWSQSEDILLLGPDVLLEMEKIVRRIQHIIKTTHDRYKSYANKKITHREFKIWDHVYLRLNTRKFTLRTGTYPKLAQRFCGPFKILDRIGPIAYQLGLPSHIKVNNFFYVSLLKKYVHDSSHIIDWKVT